MLKALIKSRISAFVSMMFAGLRKRNKKVSKGTIILYSLLLIYVVGVFLALFGTMFGTVAEVTVSFDMAWLYFTLAAVLAFAIMFIFSIFYAKAQIYDAKDNELLLAMPIPPKYILISRIAVLLLTNLAYELLVILPAAVMWCIKGRVTAFGVFAFIMIFLCLPFLSLSISCIFAWLLSVLSSKIKNKNIFSVFFTVLFLVVYFFGYTKAMNWVQNFALYAESVADTMRNTGPLYWIGNCIANDRPIELLLCVLIFMVPFILTFTLLYKSFIKIATTKVGFKKTVYKTNVQKAQSPQKALLKREFLRLGSSSTYLINSCVGLLFIVGLPIFALVKKSSIQTGFVQGGDGLLELITLGIGLGLCFMQSMCTVTAASVSMEGRSLWIARTLPLDAKDILKAKLLTQIVIVSPAVLFAVAVLSYVFGLSAVNILLAILLNLIYVPLSAEIGLFENLKHPILDWTNETVAVKQGMSVLFTMLIQMGLVIAAFAGFMGLGRFISVTVYLAIISAVFALLAFLCYRWLMTKGVKKFEKL